MADVGEMTEARKAIQAKKFKVELTRLDVKMGELEIRRLERLEELENIEKKIKEVEGLIEQKKLEAAEEGLEG